MMNFANKVNKMETHLALSEYDQFVLVAAGVIESLLRNSYLELFRHCDFEERRELVEMEANISKTLYGVEKLSLIELSSLHSSSKALYRLAEIKKYDVKNLPKIDWNCFSTSRNALIHGRNLTTTISGNYCIKIINWIKTVAEILDISETSLYLPSISPQNVYDAIPVVRKYVESYVSNNTPIIIKNLALDMQLILHELENIIHNTNFKNLEYRGLIINPESKAIRKFCKIEVSAIGASHVIHAIPTILNHHQLDLEKRNISISIRKYSYLPILHGFILNDERAIWSLTEMTEHGIIGGNSIFCNDLIQRKSTQQNSNAKSFLSWFDHNWSESLPI